MTASLFIAIAPIALLVLVFIVGLLQEVVMVAIELCRDTRVKPAQLPKCRLVSADGLLLFIEAEWKPAEFPKCKVVSEY